LPDVEALIAATSEAQGKVAITAMLLGYEQAWFDRKDKALHKTT
jgi:hypothetical protein